MNWYKQAIRIKEFTIQKALDILGLQPGATEAEVKAARNSLARKYHTDRGAKSHEQMADVNDAFGFLSARKFDTSVKPSVSYWGAPWKERAPRPPTWDENGKRKSWQEEEEEDLRSRNNTPPWETDLRNSYFTVGDDFKNLNFCKKSIWEESLKNGSVKKYTIWPFDGYFRAPFTVWTNEATLGYAGMAMYEWSAKGANPYNIVAVFAQPYGTKVLRLVYLNGKEAPSPWKEYVHDSFNGNPGNDQHFVNELRNEFLRD